MTNTTSLLTLMTALALTACGSGGGSTPDTTPPTIRLSGPGSVTAAGSVTFTATASDASGIASVTFARGGTRLGTDTTAPYEQSITFSAAENGSQTITATATDPAGNTATATQRVSVSIGTDGGSVVTRLSGCTPVGMSSDPAASACLAGTYTGQTIDHQDCTLTVRAGGGYDYASPTLNHTYVPAADSIRIFDYARIQGFHQLTWRVGDPVQAVAHDLTFSARWGTGVSHPTLEIKAERKDSGTVSSTCILPLA